jgi:MOSC domain-containing protein YiiM
MFQGELVGIFITREKGGACERREAGVLHQGRGLEGDRYFFGAKGSGPALPQGAREVTLFEAEVLEALRTEGGPRLDASAMRRNLLTRGVPLNHLVGRVFQVGGARLRGVMLCEPCVRLDLLTGQKLIRPLLHRGGLRAAVLQGGAIACGDAIEPIRA